MRDYHADADRNCDYEPIVHRRRLLRDDQLRVRILWLMHPDLFLIVLVPGMHSIMHTAAAIGFRDRIWVGYRHCGDNKLGDQRHRQLISLLWCDRFLREYSPDFG
jgi:hypothetical protein